MAVGRHLPHDFLHACNMYAAFAWHSPAAAPASHSRGKRVVTIPSGRQCRAHGAGGAGRSVQFGQSALSSAHSARDDAKTRLLSRKSRSGTMSWSSIATSTCTVDGRRLWAPQVNSSRQSGGRHRTRRALIKAQLYNCLCVDCCDSTWYPSRPRAPAHQRQHPPSLASCPVCLPNAVSQPRHRPPAHSRCSHASYLEKTGRHQTEHKTAKPVGRPDAPASRAASARDLVECEVSQISSERSRVNRCR